MMFDMPILALGPIMTFIVQTVIAIAISTGLAIAFAKKPKDAKPAGKEAFELPTAMEDRPYPLVSGTREVMSPNAISPILEFYAKKKKRRSGFSSVTVGYYYFITLRLGVANAYLDAMNRFAVAEYTVWPTPGDPDTYAGDGQTTATINAPECFGGTDREGGVKGTVDIQYGAEDQTLDSYVEGILGSTQPADRGFSSITWRLVYIGFNTPYLKPWSIMCKRITKQPDGTAMWYVAKASIVLDGDNDRPHLNAIHWLYERMVCPRYGLGKDSATMGTSWAAAADTCYTEGYGISNIWDSAPDDIESVVQQVEAIIDGKIYQDPITGKYEIGLIRADYDPDTLEEFDEEDFWVESMPTSSPGTIPTMTVVKWFDRSSRQARPARSSDIALRYRQGGIRIPQEFDYSAFVCSPTLAGKIADREQQQISAMPKSLTLRALRTMSHLHETSVIKISYPALNIVSMVVRVMTIDRGGLGEGECILKVVEDVFGAVYTVNGTPPDSGASPGSETPSDRPLDEGTVEAAGTVASTENGPY